MSFPDYDVMQITKRFFSRVQTGPVTVGTLKQSIPNATPEKSDDTVIVYSFFCLLVALCFLFCFVFSPVEDYVILYDKSLWVAYLF